MGSLEHLENMPTQRGFAKALFAIGEVSASITLAVTIYAKTDTNEFARIDFGSGEEARDSQGNRPTRRGPSPSELPDEQQLDSLQRGHLPAEAGLIVLVPRGFACCV